MVIILYTIITCDICEQLVGLVVIEVTVVIEGIKELSYCIIDEMVLALHTTHSKHHGIL